MCIETKEIINSYREHKNVERLFEELSHIGHAPQLLYDDDGSWAVTGNGSAILSRDLIGDVYLDLHFTAPAYEFKPTIAEAVERYIKDELE